MSRINTRSQCIAINVDTSIKNHSSFSCGRSKCTREVRNKGISCDACKNWFHPNCGKITNKVYKLYTEFSVLKWVCPSCMDILNKAREVTLASHNRSSSTSQDNLNNSIYFDLGNDVVDSADVKTDKTLELTLKNVKESLKSSDTIQAKWVEIGKPNKKLPKRHRT